MRSGSSSWASLRNLKLAYKSEMIENMGRQKIFSSLEDGKFCNDVFRPCKCEYIFVLRYVCGDEHECISACVQRQRINLSAIYFYFHWSSVFH